MFLKLLSTSTKSCPSFRRCRKNRRHKNLTSTTPSLRRPAHPFPFTYTPFYDTSGARQGPCLHPWADLVVNARGLATCCPENRTRFGNIREKSAEELWNSEAAQKVRRLVAAGQYQEAGCDRECPFLRGRFKEPAEAPPPAELINPDFDMPEDQTPYARNVARVIDDYRHRREVMAGFPLFVDIQPVLRCNADCIMCGQPHDSRLVHNQSIRTKLSRLKPFANYFRWQGGEVFLDRSFRRQLVEATRDTTHPHLRLYVITNGVLLDEPALRTLATGPKPVFFLVSIDGVREETYQQVRRNLRFDRAMGCLRTLALLQRETGRTLVRWNYVVMKSTVDEIAAAMSLAVELGVTQLCPHPGPLSGREPLPLPGPAPRRLAGPLAARPGTGGRPAGPGVRFRRAALAAGTGPGADGGTGSAPFEKAADGPHHVVCTASRQAPRRPGESTGRSA
jgi:MoaA/NifB/PqqE/SkfB family radical SAM enzyme